MEHRSARSNPPARAPRDGAERPSKAAGHGRTLLLDEDSGAHDRMRDDRSRLDLAPAAEIRVTGDVDDLVV